MAKKSKGTKKKKGVFNGDGKKKKGPVFNGDKKKKKAAKKR